MDRDNNTNHQARLAAQLPPFDPTARCAPA